MNIVRGPPQRAGISVGVGVRVGVCVAVSVTVAVGVIEAETVGGGGLRGLKVPQPSMLGRNRRQHTSETRRLALKEGFGFTVLIEELTYRITDTAPFIQWN
jgi:hypothetical protein